MIYHTQTWVGPFFRKNQHALWVQLASLTHNLFQIHQFKLCTLFQPYHLIGWSVWSYSNSIVHFISCHYFKRCLWVTDYSAVYNKLCNLYLSLGLHLTCKVSFMPICHRWRTRLLFTWKLWSSYVFLPRDSFLPWILLERKERTCNYNASQVKYHKLAHSQRQQWVLRLNVQGLLHSLSAILNTVETAKYLGTRPDEPSKAGREMIKKKNAKKALR